MEHYYCAEAKAEAKANTNEAENIFWLVSWFTSVYGHKFIYLFFKKKINGSVELQAL